MLTRLAHGSDPPWRWRELLLCWEEDDESKANVARLCSSRLRAHSDLTLSSDPATRRRLLLIRGAPALRHHSHIELAFLSSAARRWIASEYHIDRGLRPGFYVCFANDAACRSQFRSCMPAARLPSFGDWPSPRCFARSPIPRPGGRVRALQVTRVGLGGGARYGRVL